MTEEQVCRRKVNSSTSQLLGRSTKFFSCVFIAGYLLSQHLETLYEFNRIYLYFIIGLCVSTYASYLKLMFWFNPNYQSSCNCNPDTMFAGVLNVLKHKKSALLFNIPNTVFGMIFYTFMIFFNIFGTIYFSTEIVYLITLALTVVSCVGSLYLWYTMVAEVGSICVICSTIHAVSFLTLISLIN